MRKFLFAATFLAVVLYSYDNMPRQVYQPPQRIEPPAIIEPLRENASLVETVNETPSTISIASFNIQIFGKSKTEKEDVMGVLTDIVRQYDITAIQEVRDSSEETIPYFVNRLNNGSSNTYDYVRFSEDLDFNASLEPDKVKSVVSKVLKSFTLLGIEYSFIKEELFERSYTSAIRFKGPLYANREDSTNSIRLDIGKRKTKIKNIICIKKIFSDVPSFFISCMPQEEILAEKVGALLSEPKPRHLFDVWAMKNQNIRLNKKLLKKKLEEGNIKSKKVVFCSKQKYEKELKDLVYPLVPYKQIIKEVKKFLIF